MELPSEVFSSSMETKRLDLFKLMMLLLADQLMKLFVLFKGSNSLMNMVRYAQLTGNQDPRQSNQTRMPRKNSSHRHIPICEEKY